MGWGPVLTSTAGQLQAMEKGGVLLPLLRHHSRNVSPRAAGSKDSTELCAWLCLLMSQTGAPGLCSGTNGPRVLGMGSALGLAVPVPCIAAAQCPVLPQSWH